MSIAAAIREKLMISLRPTRLGVINESYLLCGPPEFARYGESHFRVLVMSFEFAGAPMARSGAANSMSKPKKLSAMGPSSAQSTPPSRTSGSIVRDGLKGRRILVIQTDERRRAVWRMRLRVADTGNRRLVELKL